MREGEIVQVQGGHIILSPHQKVDSIRATGRKDRHSKVYTAKGPRDRRVRLSAHTAIQFYDVQHRLGYDHPSKAVDWLMKKAKSAIDKLAQLPPFDPVAGANSAAAGVNVEVGQPDLGGGGEIVPFQGFHGYPHQDLCLSLQSFQNPGLDPGNPNSNHALFPVGFEAGPSSGGGGGQWAAAQEANLAEMGQFSRLLAWSGGGGGGSPSQVSALEDPELKVNPGSTLPLENRDTAYFGESDESDEEVSVVDIELQNLPNALNGDLLLDDGIMEKRKDCCSIFFLLPEEYEFERDTLIQLWMAEGYIKDELMGHECFHSILNEECLSRSVTNFMTRKDKYRINIKKINDLLDGQRDNGSFYLKWENECQKNTDSTHIQHVSLVCNDIDASIFRTLQPFNDLRTLLFLRNYGKKFSQIPNHFFQSFKELRALDMSRTNIKKLPSSVGYMIHLHYLDLSWTLIEWLPDILCSLYELQTLKLLGCSKLRGLPRQLKKLAKLRHLDVDVLRQLATVPRGIGALVNLRTLSAFLVGTEDGCKIQELKELNSLTGDFCIAMLENVGSADEAMEAYLNKKQYLDKLELRWTASQLSRTDNNCYDVLDYLRPCSSLKELQIFCYESSTFPDWVSDPTFNQLVSVTFFKCEHVSELPLIEQLPFLKQLELVKMNGVKKIERRGKPEEVAFSSLEKLEIDEMQNLEVWSWVKTNEGDYKSLVELTIHDCPELHEFHVLRYLSSIKHLEVRGCSKLESLSEMELPDSLEELIVEDCPRIKKKCSQEGEDWYKIQHVSDIRISVEKNDDDDGNDEDEC